MLTYGLSRSPTRANFQKMPRTLRGAVNCCGFGSRRIRGGERRRLRCLGGMVEGEKRRLRCLGGMVEGEKSGVGVVEEGESGAGMVKEGETKRRRRSG